MSGQTVVLKNGYKVYLQDLVPKNKTSDQVVVFLHGSGAGASGHSNFKANFPFLVDNGFRVIVPDLIGYGGSDKPDDVDYHLDFFVECVKQALDAIGLTERRVLVGNSLGGAVAIKYALDYPQEVSKLILMAPGGIESRRDYMSMPGMALMAEVFGGGAMSSDKLARFIKEGLVYDSNLVTDELITERWAAFKTQNSRVLTTMVVPNMTDRLPEIKCPTLVFWGLNEKMMPETGIMKLAKNIEDVKVVLVSKCGHWVMVEHKDMFNNSVLGFLKSQRS